MNKQIEKDNENYNSSSLDDYFELFEDDSEKIKIVYENIDFDDYSL